MWTRRAALALCLAASALKADAMTLDDLKTRLLGDWTSLATELRPSGQKNLDGSLEPLYLRRDFRYLAGDRFDLTVTSCADALGKLPLARMRIAGHMLWRGDHA